MNDIEGVEQRLGELVRRLANVEQLGPDDDFFDAGLASVQALELLLEIEDMFLISLSDDEFTEVRTVRELTNLVSAAGARS